MYGLFIDGYLSVMSNDAGLLLEMSPQAATVQVVRMSQPVAEEREFYAMVAFVANNPASSLVDVSMEFNMSIGTAIKVLARLEEAGLVKSHLCIEGKYSKQVRRYSAA